MRDVHAKRDPGSSPRISSAHMSWQNKPRLSATALASAGDSSWELTRTCPMLWLMASSRRAACSPLLLEAWLLESALVTAPQQLLPACQRACVSAPCLEGCAAAAAAGGLATGGLPTV